MHSTTASQFTFSINSQMSNPSSALTIYAGINLVVFQCCGKQVLPTSDRHVLFKIPWLDKESVGGGRGGEEVDCKGEGESEVWM